MSRPKGGTNKYWTADEKLKIVNMVLIEHKSYSQIEKLTGVSIGQAATWVKKYKDNGYKGLVNKRKPGNPISKYQRKKNLTDVEQLEYENMLLRIENERLKKGYCEKDVLSAKEK